MSDIVRWLTYPFRRRVYRCDCGGRGIKRPIFHIEGREHCFAECYTHMRRDFKAEVRKWDLPS